MLEIFRFFFLAKFVRNKYFRSLFPQCLGENFTDLPGMETPFVVDSLDKLVRAVICSSKEMYSEDNLSMANQCIHLFVDSLQDVVPGMMARSTYSVLL